MLQVITFTELSKDQDQVGDQKIIKYLITNFPQVFEAGKS